MKIPFTKYAIKGYNAKLQQQYDECRIASEAMQRRSHARFHIINALLQNTQQKRYLEIGVRNLEDNFNRINADFKVCVDPGYEAAINHATFPMTSDDFFDQLHNDRLDIEHNRFDVIFLDGLHLADQLYRDIQNALQVVADTGFIVLHDCNPPTLHHARENFREQSPAAGFWNGTCWKAFQRIRTETDKRCFVVDVDWGVGVIVNHDEDPAYRLPATVNPFYEFNVLEANRREILNLVQPMDVAELRDNL
ncbi:hypothetical protein Poly24_32370 [Rosistilla carotiformis]|uniref:Methyltransferase domain protein n=1 Tax=Rosistilla carotiformis TaxID=2528017 RepID=A0A518JVE7_9BACT|nr:class I SAM-dependent methyltransferase [Rosistilla carotiformis]QDV69521.1 hypothetical protein Poly24_32370 [Rosistilla carotiformis]